jgi:beta-glucosidase
MTKPAHTNSADSPFPAGFLWGASTSSHQVEGDNHNDWTVWEEANAQRLAAAAQQNPSLPPHVRAAAHDPRNYISGAAADHYHRFATDFDLAAELGHTAQRFSIEWSRIIPEPGEIDMQEVSHYQEVVAALRQRGLEPVVTLWHFTLPKWVAARGGWANARTIEYFCEYVRVISAAIPEIKFWLTINEPNIYSTHGYLLNKWPPGQRTFFNYFRSQMNMAEAHRRAYKIIKLASPMAQVGIAHNGVYFIPSRNNVFDKFAVRLSRWWNNFWFLDRLQGHQDFIGFNFYFRNRMHGFQVRNMNERVSDMGWELYPEGVGRVCLEYWDRYHLPVMVTENGLADANDAHREWYLTEVIKSIAAASHSGAHIIGYLHWSLLDNFEWAEGFWPRFGLIEVDYTTQKRTIRKSALAYRDIIKSMH